MCVSCVCAQACTSILCENSVRNKKPISLQVVQAQSVCVCVCVFVCVCVCVCVCVHVCVCHVCVHRHVQVYFVKTV